MATTTLASTSLPATDMVTEKQRISSIDIVRGIVMVIMALDHTRDFFHKGAFVYDATNMGTTTPLLFFTRWITHYCAPTFVFLAGTSIYLITQRKSKKELSLFLLTRGLWLIFLEVVVVRFSFFFNFYYDATFFQVIWAIGASMVCMSLLVRLSDNMVLALALLITFGHNIFDYFRVGQESPLFGLWTILRQAGLLSFDSGKILIVPYPLLPWLGVMLLGYSLGRLYVAGFDAERRRKMLFALGAGAIALFIILRLINIYGDPSPWAPQADAMFTFMSFVNTTKYPISLLYTLMTLGPVLIVLALMEHATPGSLKPLTVFGRVPLFYYVLHFFIIHVVALLLFMTITGASPGDVDFHFNKTFGGITTESGYALRWTYVAWILIVLFLYPLCQWYNRYKSTHKQWWLSYL